MVSSQFILYIACEKNIRNVDRVFKTYQLNLEKSINKFIAN